MPGQCELCGAESLHVVAIFAAILVRRARKLPLVNILVAVLALGLRDLE